MMAHVAEVYRERRANNEPTNANGFYLAKLIKEACEKVLQRPAAAMEFIRKLAEESAGKGKPLEWTSPTGFPWRNRYYEPIVKTVHLELRSEYVPVRHRVADGFQARPLAEEVHGRGCAELRSRTRRKSPHTDRQ